AHERHGREQLPCFDEVEPCIPILSLFLERTRLVPEPCSIVPAHLTRPRIKPSQFPVVTYLLQYERKSGWRFCCDVQDHDPILAWGQIRNLEDRTVRRLSRSPENTAEKFGASDGGRSLRLEQEWGPFLGLGPRAPHFRCAHEQPTPPAASDGWVIVAIEMHRVIRPCTTFQEIRATYSLTAPASTTVRRFDAADRGCVKRSVIIRLSEGWGD